MSDGSDNAVRTLVLTVHRRLLARAMAEAAGVGALLGGAVAVGARLLLPEAGQVEALVAGGLVGIACTMVRFMSRRPEPLAAAMACDAAAGKHELFSTAWTLGQTPAADPAWHDAILSQAMQAASDVIVADVGHGNAHPGRLVVGLMLLVAAGLWSQEPSAGGVAGGAAPAVAGRRGQEAARADERRNAAWPAASVRRPGERGQTAQRGGPEMLAPGDASAQVGPDARRLGTESGSSASAGRGEGSGLARTNAAGQIRVHPAAAGRGSTAAGQGDADGYGRAASRTGSASAGGQVAAGDRSAVPPRRLSQDGTAEARSAEAQTSEAAGPTATAIEAVPAAYRQVVREYFNR